jgi:site-specific DNA-cytosine methylase
MQAIPVVDLFAGPGGLGEGFSAYRDQNGFSPFRISLSIEKDNAAHQTLELRSFVRQFERDGAPDVYYKFLAGKLDRSALSNLLAWRYRQRMRAWKAGMRSSVLNLLHKWRVGCASRPAKMHPFSSVVRHVRPTP